jgi:hypothetical protein
MAARLLAEADAGSSSEWCTWIDSLPAAISTPVSFTPEESQACRVPQTVADILDMQRCLEESHQVGYWCCSSCC